MRVVWLLILGLAGCNFSGGLHQQGDRRLVAEASYGKSDHTEPFLWQGSGKSDNYGVMIGYAYHWRDRVGLQAKLTPVRIYDQSDGPVYAFEFQIGLRWYLFEISERLGFFLEALGGMSHASKSIPEQDGSMLNFTQDTGFGLEFMINDEWSILGGYRYSHLSNGTGEGVRNPSQNDHEWWLGVGWDW